jgi:AraC-like DNA-binding protein
MEQLALTRASTIGPIVDIVDRGGGSVERVFSAAELPLQLSETPDALVPLRDQFKLVEFAARELGDDASAGIAGLGVYGRRFISAPSLGAAIRMGNDIIGSTLQSATRMTLTVDRGLARWTYGVADPARIGRQKNAILATGYIVDLLRRFVGANWTPTRAELPGAPLQSRTAIEALYRCEMATGDEVAVSFPADLLEIPNPAPAHCDALELDGALPLAGDFCASVRELIRLSLLDRRPQRAWVARRLNVSVRTLQRHLREHRTSFAEAVRSIVEQRAVELLRCRNVSVTEIAYELGYSDPAHFTRAFVHWFGEPPHLWRRRQGRVMIGALHPPGSDR